MVTRLDTMLASTTLVVEECCSCSMLFAMSEEFQQRALDDRGPQGVVFYCPRGHKQWYTGETEKQKLARQLKNEQQSTRWYADQLAAAERDAEHERRSKAAIKGHMTRLRNKVAAGVCPVGACRRPFHALQDHLASVHPGWLEEHDLTIAALEAPTDV